MATTSSAVNDVYAVMTMAADQLDALPRLSETAQGNSNSWAARSAPKIGSRCNMNNRPPSRKRVRSESTNYKLEPWERQAMVEAYVNHEKTTAVAAEFGVSAQYVGLLARRRGYKSRGVGRPPKMGHLANPAVSASFG